MSFPKTRLYFFVFFIGLVTLILTYRLFDLQIRKGHQYHFFSQSNSLREQRIFAPRGKIQDRYGKILATNEIQFALTLNLAQTQSKDAAFKTLAHLLEIDVASLKKKISPGQTTIVLVTNLDRNAMAKLRAKISQMQSEPHGTWDFNGIALELRYARVYPQGKELGHLLGYVREINAETLSQWEKKEAGRMAAGSKIGLKGIEKKFDEKLRGHDGFKQSFVDALGHQVKLKEFGLENFLKNLPVQTGEDLTLTIDAKLSHAAYRAFQNQVGALVALNPQNGEILAMVSKPSYHPETLSGVIPTERWERLRDHPHKILLNRPMQGAYPPGSIHKIITATAALAEGKVTPTEKINCPGHYTYGDRKWHCWNRKGHGSLNLHQALVQSCDVFFYRIGERLGPDRLAHYAKLLGLGKKWHVLDDYERSGLVPTQEWKLKTKKSEWTNSDNLSNAIGQGYNLVTPLQAALMMARFANGGKAIEPRILLQPNKKIQTPQPLDWKLKPEHWKLIHQALVEVVEGKSGTGKRAQLEKISIGGKTGTAQVIALERQGSGRRHTKDHAWFVAFAPAKNPEIALAVVVEHGGSGGKAAAPIAKKVLEFYFKEKEKNQLKENPEPPPPDSPTPSASP